MRLKAPILVSTVVLGGCIIHGEETATERFRFDISGQPRIEVRLDEGSIEVLGTRSNEVTVNVIKVARGPSPEAAAAMLDRLSVDVHQEGTTVHVEARRGTDWGWHHEGISVRTGLLRSDVEIRLPQEADLVLVTGDGRIEIERVNGRIEAETSDGRLRLRDVKGAVRTRTSDGSIVGSDLEGDFDVSTGDGRIELQGRFHSLKAVTSEGSIKVRCDQDPPSITEDWMLRTSDGSIGLTLPTGLSAELEASTSDGHIVNELPLVASDQTEHRVNGRLGEGGKLILVTTSDGTIRLRSR